MGYIGTVYNDVSVPIPLPVTFGGTGATSLSDGLLKKSGTVFVNAVAGTDYLDPSSLVNLSPTGDLRIKDTKFAYFGDSDDFSIKYDPDLAGAGLAGTGMTLTNGRLLIRNNDTASFVNLGMQTGGQFTLYGSTHATLPGVAAIAATTFTTTATTIDASGGTISVYGSPTSITLGSAASTLTLGVNSGTLSINNPTVTLGNASTLNMNGANPVLASSNTGTLSLFNTNISAVNAFGAATSVKIGISTILGINVTPTAGVGTLQVSGNVHTTSDLIVGEVGSTSFSGKISNASNVSRSIIIEADPTNVGTSSYVNFKVDAASVAYFGPGGYSSMGPGASASSYPLYLTHSADTTMLYIKNTNAVNRCYISLYDNANNYLTVQSATTTASITSSNAFELKTGGNNIRVSVDTNGNVIVGTGQLVDNATNGFLYIPGTTSGAPSGTPTSYTGRHPIVYDDTNNKLYIYNGSWQQVSGGTTGGAMPDYAAIQMGVM